MILPIRLYGDPVLRQKARPVTDFKPIPKLAADMMETMFEANGVGLAAPQIGQSLRLFVAVEYADDEPEGEEEPKSRVVNEYVMVNPIVEVLDQTQVLGLEGCLSIPQLYEEGVPRVRALRINYQNEHGEHRSIEAEDFLARVFQHEYDHLEGRLFFDLLPPEIFDKHRAELAEMQRQAKQFLKEERERQKQLKQKKR